MDNTRWNHHDFKSSICEFYKRRHNCDMKEDWVLYSPSVMYSVSLLIRLLSKPKIKLLHLTLCMIPFFTVVEDNDRILVSHSLKHENNTFVIDFNLLEEQLKDASILLLCSPHNPTGRVWTKEEMEKNGRDL